MAEVIDTSPSARWKRGDLATMSFTTRNMYDASDTPVRLNKTSSLVYGPGVKDAVVSSNRHRRNALEERLDPRVNRTAQFLNRDH